MGPRKSCVLASATRIIGIPEQSFHIWIAMTVTP
jgi:hypothetical protein